VNLSALGGAARANAKVITVLGAGHIGASLARAWIRAGHDVRLAVRDPVAPAVVDLVEHGAKAIAIDNAANGSDIVVLAIPANAVAEALPRIGDTKGRILVDCTNSLGPGLIVSAPTSSSSTERLASLVKDGRVVRAFHQQGAETLRDARFGDQRAASFVASDDDDARRTVLSLSHDVGLDAIDAGPLQASRFLDHLTIVWLTLVKTLGSREIALTLLRR
jgi:predicted dinucleotide-binding enzyme